MPWAPSPSFLPRCLSALIVDQVPENYEWARLVPESLMRSVDHPPKTMPRIEPGPRWDPTRHQQDWLQACKSGEQAGSSFDYSGPLTEMVLSGNVALAAGKPIAWDKEKMEITNDAEANRLLRREYRKVWSL